MSSRNFIVVLAGALLVAVGCGLHPGEAWNRSDTGGPIGSAGGGATTSGDDVTDQSQGLCPTSSPLLAARHPAGDICTSPSDCVSTCCDCGTGSQSWLAASCVAGRCADSVTSCGRTTARYCGNGGVIVVPVPVSGQCTSGSTACDACINAKCCAESLACRGNASCVGLESCDANCAANATCRDLCYETHAAGAQTLQSLDTCVATACGAVCEP
jgi:hypothetical protein